MSQPTIEDIESVILKYADYLNGHKTMAKAIHEMFQPKQYKPLSELHLDENACQLIAASLLRDYSFVSASGNDTSTVIHCYKSSTEERRMIIQHDGMVRIMDYGHTNYHLNAFKVVLLIQDLGYSLLPVSQ